MGSTDISASAAKAAGKRKFPVGRIAAGVIVGALVLALVGWNLHFRSKVKAELDAIRKAGFPVTLRELSEYYPVPRGKNAADLYARAFAEYAGHDMENKVPLLSSVKLPPRGEPLPDDMKTNISAYLAANAQALELLHKAAAIEGCRFDVDFSRGFNITLPNLEELRRAARLLELQALMKVEEGKPDEAATAIADSLGAARALQNEPLLLSQLVRMGLVFMSLNNLERVLSRTALRDQQLTKFSEAIASQENHDTWTRGLAGERCIAEDWFSNSYSPGRGPPYADGLAGALYSYLWDWSGLKARDSLKYLQLANEIISPTERSVGEMGDRDAELFKEIQDAPKRVSLQITPLLFPTRHVLEMVARFRAARAGIAVERFRMANGRLPDSLDELTPKWLKKVPPDLFGDGPIRYKKLAKGFVAYSIGPDEKDHGGIEVDPKYPEAPHDITFIVAR
jgi:hypothetical protein